MSERFDWCAQFSAVADRHDHSIRVERVCPGAEAAQAAVPPRDLIDLGGDLGEIETALHAIQHEIDRGIDDGRSDRDIALAQLGAFSEAVRRLAEVYSAWAALAVGAHQ